jgi:hypothetical protein
MASFLGATANFYWDGPSGGEYTTMIQAMTGDGYFVGEGAFHAVTSSQAFQIELADGSTFFTGDYVNGTFDFLSTAVSNDFYYGVWLSRVSGDPTSPGEDVPPRNVPEPATWTLLGFGLTGLLARRRMQG